MSYKAASNCAGPEQVSAVRDVAGVNDLAHLEATKAIRSLLPAASANTVRYFFGIWAMSASLGV